MARLQPKLKSLNSVQIMQHFRLLALPKTKCATNTISSKGRELIGILNTLCGIFSIPKRTSAETNYKPTKTGLFYRLNSFNQVTLMKEVPKIQWERTNQSIKKLDNEKGRHIPEFHLLAQTPSQQSYSSDHSTTLYNPYNMWENENATVLNQKTSKFY